MGGVDSKLDNEVKARQDFAWWNRETVERAYERALKIKPVLGTEEAKTLMEGVRITRREFWDVFTDYTTLKDDSWLSLPLSVFTIFDDENEGTVDVLEVFLMLALFADGDMNEQLRFCFTMFDTDHSGNISLDEMEHFFHVLCRGSYKVCHCLPVLQHVLSSLLHLVTISHSYCVHMLDK